MREGGARGVEAGPSRRPSARQRPPPRGPEQPGPVRRTPPATACPPTHGGLTPCWRPLGLSGLARRAHPGSSASPAQCFFAQSPGSYTWWGAPVLLPRDRPSQTVSPSPPLSAAPLPTPLLRAKVQAGRISGETEPAGPPPHPGLAHPTPQRSSTQADPGLGAGPRRDPARK